MDRMGNTVLKKSKEMERELEKRYI